MTYNNDIDVIEQKAGQIKIEAKTQSLYACIRYASKFMKRRTQIRKHRTLPNDVPITSIASIYELKEKHLSQEENEKVNEEMNCFIHHEKQHLTSLPPPPRTSSWAHKQFYHKSQIIYSTTKSEFNRPNNIVHEEVEENKTIASKEYNYEEQDTISNNNEEYNFEELLDTSYSLKDSNYDSSYALTLQKLSGETVLVNNKNKPNTAVLITLSPSALAAANAAIQKRQRIRNY
ncbi:uncharacterized protein BX663DRAFT_491373, partial [Cokeromyces recurvatus]|uniref:uncharacterized protein n=1 Tax=Cokeromyces recurvatus TaxID=90255 RepID=UPI00221E7EA5